MAVDIIYKFEIEELYTIFKNDTELLSCLSNYSLMQDVISYGAREKIQVKINKDTYFSGNMILIIRNTASTVSVEDGDTVDVVAGKIRDALYTDWDTSGEDGVIIFTAKNVGVKTGSNALVALDTNVGYSIVIETEGNVSTKEVISIKIGCAVGEFVATIKNDTFSFDVLNGATIEEITESIVNAEHSNWSAYNIGNLVYFTAIDIGAQAGDIEFTAEDVGISIDTTILTLGEESGEFIGLKNLAELLLNNKSYLSENTIEDLLSEEFLFDEIGYLFGKGSLPIPVYHQMFYSFKYSTIRNFFKKNYQNFLPEIDYIYTQEKPKLKLYIESLMKELDKFSDIIDKIYDVVDIDKAPTEYLNYLAQLIGYEREDSVLLQDSSYRELIKNMIEIYKIKGTNYSFELFLNFLGFDITLYEYWFDKRFYYSKSSVNNYTGSSDRDSSYFYMSPIKPTEIVYDDFYKNIVVSDKDIGEAKNIYKFNRLIEEGVALENLLGISTIDEGGNTYTGEVFTYFKTNAIDYNIKKIKAQLIDSSEEISQTDLVVINKYIEFLTPIFIIKNIVFGVNEFEDKLLNIKDITEYVLYSINSYLEDSIILNDGTILALSNAGLLYTSFFKNLNVSFADKSALLNKPKLSFNGSSNKVERKKTSFLLDWPLEYYDINKEPYVKDISGYVNYGTIETP